MANRSVIETMEPVIRGRHLADREDLVADQAGPDGLAFEALLYPHRSLPNAGFYAVMVVVVAVNIFSALYYSALGAWPVIFFCGLDIAAVYLAFRISYRQGRLHERIMLFEEALWVSRVLPSGHETRWKLQPFWTRVEIDDPVAHESQLKLVSHGRTLILGSFLSPEERGELANALRTALGAAKTPSQTSTD